MARPSLVLYLDVVSPFAYLAFYVVTVSEPSSLYSDESLAATLFTRCECMSITESTIKLSGISVPFKSG